MARNRAGQAEGERRKDAKLETLQAWRKVYVNRGRRVLLETLLNDGEATADDIRYAVGLPAGLDPRCLGAVPRALVKAGIIRRSGFERCSRPERHASYVGIWKLVDRAAALRWLDSHPDLADPPPGDDGGHTSSSVSDQPSNTSPEDSRSGVERTPQNELTKTAQ